MTADKSLAHRLIASKKSQATARAEKRPLLNISTSISIVPSGLGTKLIERENALRISLLESG
jgi:hypothetical protein